MENVSATSLYVKACKFLLSSETSWDQLMAMLPRLRNALTCRVCRGLVVDPVGSKYCQHSVCRTCLKRKRALNPGCKWCLDWSKLEHSNGQTRVVLACYKLLCEAIKSSNYYRSGDKNLILDNLLQEAQLITNVQPNSSVVVSNNSNILDGKPNKMAAVSRDQIETCARENVASTGGKREELKGNELTANGISETFDEQSAMRLKSEVAVADKKNERQRTVKMENGDIINNTNTMTNDSSMIDDMCRVELNVEITNDETKLNMLRKVESNNKRACLRPRNGQLVQKFEAGRHMRKRKVVSVNKIVRKRSAQTLSKSLDQKYAQKKKCKLNLS